jgi:hypothetical protein
MDNRPTSISLRDSGDTRAAKLLICAPSNAAIDEVTRRLKDGVPSANGKLVIPRIIRIGNENTMNLAVRDVSLDALVEARVSSAQMANGKGDTSSDISRAEQALEKIKKDRETLQTELQSVGDNHLKEKCRFSKRLVSRRVGNSTGHGMPLEMSRVKWTVPEGRPGKLYSERPTSSVALWLVWDKNHCNNTNSTR